MDKIIMHPDKRARDHIIRVLGYDLFILTRSYALHNKEPDYVDHFIHTAKILNCMTELTCCGDAVKHEADRLIHNLFGI